jgi:hypothetical protein
MTDTNQSETEHESRRLALQLANSAEPAGANAPADVVSRAQEYFEFLEGLRRSRTG